MSLGRDCQLHVLSHEELNKTLERSAFVHCAPEETARDEIERFRLSCQSPSLQSAPYTTWPLSRRRGSFERVTQSQETF